MPTEVVSWRLAKVLVAIGIGSRIGPSRFVSTARPGDVAGCLLTRGGVTIKIREVEIAVVCHRTPHDGVVTQIATDDCSVAALGVQTSVRLICISVVQSITAANDSNAFELCLRIFCLPLCS